MGADVIDIDPATMTDAELNGLSASVNAERVRRARLNNTPARLAEMFAEYHAQGGDCDALAAEAQRLAAEPAPTREVTR